LVLISGSRIGAITAPIGFITLNIISIRIIFIKAAHPGLPDEAQSKPLPPPDPAENCRELGLSKRESEVALLLAKGCTYKELAAELFISMSTTQTHVGRIYSKLGINNKTELSNLINYQQSKI
jgi:DNA-binding NarL/FixJ family response regulator